MEGKDGSSTMITNSCIALLWTNFGGDPFVSLENKLNDRILLAFFLPEPACQHVRVCVCVCVCMCRVIPRNLKRGFWDNGSFVYKACGKFLTDIIMIGAEEAGYAPGKQSYMLF